MIWIWKNVDTPIPRICKDIIMLTPFSLEDLLHNLFPRILWILEPIMEHILPLDFGPLIGDQIHNVRAVLNVQFQCHNLRCMAEVYMWVLISIDHWLIMRLVVHIQSLIQLYCGTRSHVWGAQRRAAWLRT